MISKDDILRRLTELNISQTTYEHPPVMTSADLANVCTPSTVLVWPIHPHQWCLHMHAENASRSIFRPRVCAERPLSHAVREQVPELAGVDGANVKNLFLKARCDGADVLPCA